MPNLSDRIRELRRTSEMTQEEFGQKFGVVKSTVSLYENGKSTPNDEIKRKICEYFNVSLDYLHGLTDNKQGIDASTSNNTRAEIQQPISYWIGKTGLSHNEISKKLGISQDLLEDYMCGSIAPPYNILISLSDICEVSTDCLLGLRDRSRSVDLEDVLPFRYNYKIAERIRSLCEKDGITQEYLQDLLSLSENEVYYLIEYGFVPHVSTVTKLASFFNVSCDYLLCKIGEQDEKAAMSFRLLNEDNKDIIIGEIKKALLDQRREGAVAAEMPLKVAK